MRKIFIALLFGIGLTAAATPSNAQFVFDAPGVSVGVGQPRYEREREYRPERRVYREREFDRRRGYRAYDRGCQTTRIQRGDGSVRVIRRCR